ncbi:hypothetical protein IKF63_02345, partial [Candidatus Saccharibacteria bacterium]|nr:hypothetical protein [Candidatus Saccharibacteria bacterium]
MKPKITFLFVMILAVILGGAGVIVYELGFTNTMVEKLPKESVLTNYLENETKATEAKLTDSVETTSPAQSAELIEPTEVTQTAKSSKKTKAEKVTTDSIETTEVQSGNVAKVDSRLFDASNKEMEKYYTIDLSERQIQRSDFYQYAPEEFSLIPFTEMDSVREGAKGWADALSLPLTADYIVVKDGKGLVTVDLTTWMEHFVPGFTPDHKLNGEEKLYLAMGRIMTDPATGIAYGKALNRTELYSGKTLGDLNPWLVEDFINKVDEHSYNDSGKWEPGERGIELWLRVRNSDNVVVTSEEYRAYATKICVLLSQLEFMENTNDSPKEHWHLMYAVSEDYDRLPERIETEETHTWAVYRSKVRKDGLIDFGLWINIGDARPGIPGAHPVPKETTPKVERGNGVEPEKTKEE